MELPGLGGFSNKLNDDESSRCTTHSNESDDDDDDDASLHITNIIGDKKARVQSTISQQTAVKPVRPNRSTVKTSTTIVASKNKSHRTNMLKKTGLNSSKKTSYIAARHSVNTFVAVGTASSIQTSEHEFDVIKHNTSTSLRLAVGNNDLEGLLHIILASPEAKRMELVNHVNDQGFTPLLYATKKDSNLSMQCLLDFGADPNIVVPIHTSALHLACSLGHASCVEVLLRAGAQQVKNKRMLYPFQVFQGNAQGQAFALVQYVSVLQSVDSILHAEFQEAIDSSIEQAVHNLYFFLEKTHDKASLESGHAVLKKLQIMSSEPISLPTKTTHNKPVPNQEHLLHSETIPPTTSDCSMNVVSGSELVPHVNPAFPSTTSFVNLSKTDFIQPENTSIIQSEISPPPQATEINMQQVLSSFASFLCTL